MWPPLPGNKVPFVRLFEVITSEMISFTDKAFFFRLKLQSAEKKEKRIVS